MRISISASCILLAANANIILDDSNWSSAEQSLADTLPIPSDRTIKSVSSWLVKENSHVDQTAGADASLFAREFGGQMGGADSDLSFTDGL
jgi:hypothetical protein